MSSAPAGKPVERLFPFAVRARVVVAGREALRSRRKKLQLLIITSDLSENSRQSIAKDFPTVKVVEALSTDEIERHFGFRGAKVIGFLRSPIAVSILREYNAIAKAARAAEADAQLPAEASDMPSE